MSAWDGKALFVRRKAAGLTQEQAAEMFGCSASAFRTWEHGGEPSPSYRGLLDDWIAGAPAPGERPPEAPPGPPELATAINRLAAALERVVEVLERRG